MEGPDDRREGLPVYGGVLRWGDFRAVGALLMGIRKSVPFVPGTDFLIISYRRSQLGRWDGFPGAGLSGSSGRVLSI